MFHPIPKPFKGRFPFAVLHTVRTVNVAAGIEMAKKLSPDLTQEEAVAYTKAVVETKGHPQILDLIEEEREAKKPYVEPVDELEVI